MEYAPVIIPTLNRFEHLKVCLESLKKNTWAKYTDIYLGIDYPPQKKYEDGWKKICKYIESEDFSVFKSFNIIKRTENYGAVRNIEDLRERAFENHNTYIYMEDDIEAAPVFLEFIDKCLDKYKDDIEIYAICGYSYPIKWDVSDGATVLKENVSVPMWGTGFWKEKITALRKWNSNCTSTKMLKECVRYNIYEKMIDAAKLDYMEAASRPWSQHKSLVNRGTDIGTRIYLALADKYVISPVISKTKNHGFDGSGLYCGIISNNGGINTALNYDYDDQPIDGSTCFNLEEDTNCNNKENHDRLNAFDYRSYKDMSKFYKKIWIVKHLGVNVLYFLSAIESILHRIFK